ncbi:MAG TPA: hypothetical protein H9869_08830 [Candidatus Ligilactobacillus excrementipullorum]|nr:hypothetical protein [Candidatus Ligilactobacillus excrementipullorum]
MYGETIRKIRISKDLPLKSVYFGICSKTNAIQFEKGDRMLAADKFNTVLDNLMITMGEFKWINNNYRPSTKLYHNYMVGHAWNSNQLNQFKQSVRQAEVEQNSIERIQLSSYRLLRAYEQQLSPDQQELQLVINYFSNLSSWTLSDVNFFANNCYFLPYPLMTSLLTEALKAQNRYHFYHDSERTFATVLTNCIDRMLLEQDFKNALEKLAILKELTKDITMDGFRLLVNYYDAKLVFLSSNSKNGRDKLAKVCQVAEYLGNTQLVAEITEILK